MQNVDHFVTLSAVTAAELGDCEEDEDVRKFMKELRILPRDASQHTDEIVREFQTLRSADCNDTYIILLCHYQSKFCNRSYTVDADIFFEYDKGNRRGHSTKLFKSRSRLDIRKYVFVNRVTDKWNNLPQCRINCKTE